MKNTFKQNLKYKKEILIQDHYVIETVKVIVNIVNEENKHQCPFFMHRKSKKPKENVEKKNQLIKNS